LFRNLRSEFMETEQCFLCGVSVKRENLKGHYVRVHPKRPASVVRPTQTFARASVFKSHRRRNLAILALFTLAVIGISYAASEFAAANTMAMHWHPQLSVTINGSPVTVPARIGIDPSLWKDHSLDQYGMEGMSPLHTHDTSGQIHVESNTVHDFTLQEFLAVWGQRLDSNQVLSHPVDPGHRAYIIVDGVQKPMGTLDVVFVDGQRIQVVCGP